jgi:hypothetical protein
MTYKLEPTVSALVPDWSRESKRWYEWQPSRSLLASIRSYQQHRASGYPHSIALRYVAVLRHRFWSAVTGADIPLNCQIEGGLLLPHPNGVVIHPDAVIGPNCLLFQQTTLGGGPARAGRRRCAATLMSGQAPRSWVRFAWARTPRWAPMRWCCTMCPREPLAWAFPGGSSGSQDGKRRKLPLS